MTVAFTTGKRWRARGVVSISAVLASCLPDDTRPTPGTLAVQAEASDAVRAGVATVDGWTLTFTKVTLSLNSVYLQPTLGGAGCDLYSHGASQKVVDVSSGRGVQTLATLRAYGVCQAEVSFGEPGMRDVRRGE